MKLIDADALKDLIIQRFDMPDLYLLAHIIHLIDETPTADAEPVVRCKDCKWYVSEKNRCSLYWGIIGRVNEDDYCSGGERNE